MSLEILPLSGTLGAEIFGLDLQSGLTNAEFDRVHQAFIDHKVIVMRGQKTLEPDQHKAFARRFGTLNIHPYVKGMKGHPELLEIIKEKEDKVNFGGGWHTDMSFEETPALGSILHAIELPPYGGDTLFADQQAAYDALSPGLKETLGGLKAVHSAAREYGVHGSSAQKLSLNTIRRCRRIQKFKPQRCFALAKKKKKRKKKEKKKKKNKKQKNKKEKKKEKEEKNKRHQKRRRNRRVC